MVCHRAKAFRNKDGSARTYLQLVAGERVGDRVRQKVIANLGRLEQLQETTLDRLIEALMKSSTRQVYRPEREDLRLHHFYRALDFLADHKDEIKKRLYARSVDLFSLKVDLVLWDTTTTCFCGRACEGLAEYGFSKNKRPDRLQIMVGVLMTADGFPVVHEVFPGNTAEVETFRLAIKKVQKQFNLGKVILVADRGMVSEALLKEIEDARLEYIVGVRMRRAKAVREVLSRARRYSAVAEKLMVKEVVHEGIRYVMCLNPEEAERDKATREIDDEVLRAEACYDGKYVLRTNASLEPAEVAVSYKSLWQVERVFRELKSSLDLRPVYHFTDKRIRGHVAVCFLALVLESTLRRKLEELGEDNLHYDELLLSSRATQGSGSSAGRHELSREDGAHEAGGSCLQGTRDEAAAARNRTATPVREPSGRVLWYAGLLCLKPNHDKDFHT